MSDSITIAPTGPTRWVWTERSTRPSGLLERCNPAYIQKAVAHLDGVSVASVFVNTTGQFMSMAGPVATGLPDYVDVRLQQQNPGGHVADIIVWVPLDWNNRFAGVGGGGLSTGPMWHWSEPVRLNSLPRAVRNGFAAATTDGGNKNQERPDLPLQEGGFDLDWELIHNLAHRSIHEMTVVGKTVTEAVQGSPPLYSYFQGTSGGGRQALMEAQRYPGDYDGVWASDAGINWTKFIPGQLWPALVMKEYQNALPPAKLEAFRATALAAGGGAVDFLDVYATFEFDAIEVVGRETAAGVITKTDAQVMQKIWEGPRASDGRQLWYGLLPGTESWGDNLHRTGVCSTTEIAGQVVPAPFGLAWQWFSSFLLRDRAWDWTTLTFERYEELFDQGVHTPEFDEVATDNPDLSGLRDAGGKLIISHAGSDEVIPVQGAIDYYRRVVDTLGGESETRTFFRQFMAAGDVHSNVTGRWPGLTLARGMSALMEWVENDNAPDGIVGERIDQRTGEVTMVRPIRAYSSERTG